MRAGEFRTRRSREPEDEGKTEAARAPRASLLALRVEERRRRDGMKVTEKKGKTILPMPSRA